MLTAIPLYIIPITLIIFGIFFIFLLRKIQKVVKKQQIKLRDKRYYSNFFIQLKNEPQKQEENVDPIRLKIKIVCYFLNNVMQEFQWFKNLNQHKTNQDSFSNFSHFQSPMKKLKSFLKQAQQKVLQIKIEIGFKWELIQEIIQTLQTIEIIYDIVLEQLVERMERGYRPNGQMFLKEFNKEDIQLDRQFGKLKSESMQLNKFLNTQDQCLKKCNKNIHQLFCDCVNGKNCIKKCYDFDRCQSTCQQYCQMLESQQKKRCQRKCHRKDIDLTLLSILKQYRGFSDNLINLLIKYCITGPQFYNKKKQQKILKLQQLRQYPEDAKKLRQIFEELYS